MGQEAPVARRLYAGSGAVAQWRLGPRRAVRDASREQTFRGRAHCPVSPRKSLPFLHARRTRRSFKRRAQSRKATIPRSPTPPPRASLQNRVSLILILGCRLMAGMTWDRRRSPLIRRTLSSFSTRIRDSRSVCLSVTPLATRPRSATPPRWLVRLDGVFSCKSACDRVALLGRARRVGRLQQRVRVVPELRLPEFRRFALAARLREAPRVGPRPRLWHVNCRAGRSSCSISFCTAHIAARPVGRRGRHL